MEPAAKPSPDHSDDASRDDYNADADTRSSPPAHSAAANSKNGVSNLRRPPIRNNFELEPNPFEQSFSRSSNSAVKSSSDDSTDPPLQKQDNHSSANSAHSPSDTNNNPGSPKPTLPPLAALASPGPRTFQWGLGSSAIAGHNSLRAGPLSPAMLSGPTNVSGTTAFDHTSFRTGLTPGTGLTPLMGGPSSFPPPSPNTAAFLAMVTGAANANPLASVAATITPNTFSNLTSTLAPPSHGDSQPQFEQQQNSSVTSAATTAANGLFLLSQAHQELTKREEAQARAGSLQSQQNEHETVVSIPPSATSKRGAKRKQEEVVQKSAPVKKARGGRKRRGESESDIDDDDDDPDSPSYSHPSGTSKSTKDMTDEEKRRNFLERNRQAALKCRQRKKAWLSQLQAKVEFLTTENERLTTALVSSREEITRLNALVGAHGGAAPSRMQTGHMGANGSHGGGGQQPISVAVPVGSANPPGTSVTAGGGRGYGY